MRKPSLSSLGLSNQQVEAIKCKLGPVMVIAGAGAGKTTVMAHRCVYLNSRFGIDPERILCVTFTNKAVKNLKDKIVEVLDKFPPEMFHVMHGKVMVVTFHNLCKQILTSVYEQNGTPMKKCIHSSKMTPIIREILKEFPHIKAAYLVCRIMEKLRWICKSQRRAFDKDDLTYIGIRISEINSEEKILEKFPLDDMRRIYSRLDEELEKYNYMTPDDIILDARIHLFNPGVLDVWSSRFDAILCDEFQDVDDIQFEVLTLLSKKKHNLFCVGDPDQAIYGFRGALPKVFVKLRKHFDSEGIFTQLKKLEKNFRSTPQILEVANDLINYSPVQDELRKNLFTDNKNGSQPTLDVLESPKIQAKEVVDRIKKLQSQGVSLSDIVVLARNRAHYHYIKNEFLSRCIPFEDWQEVMSLLQCAEIRDLNAWIGVAFIKDNPKKWMKCFKRVYNKPSVGVGPDTLFKICEQGAENILDQMKKIRTKKSQVHDLYAKIISLKEIADDESLTIHQRCWDIARISGILEHYKPKKIQISKRDRIDTMKKFLDSPMIRKSKTWDEALLKIGEFLHDEEEPRLVCSTIHGVKGLEFEHVLLVSLSMGNIPSKRGLNLCKNQEQTDEYFDEERRLMYVACTRAKKTLHLFSDKPSDQWCPFLEDILSKIKIQKMSEKTTSSSSDYDEEEEDFEKPSIDIVNYDDF